MTRRLFGPIFGPLKRAAVCAALFVFGTALMAEDVTIQSQGGGLTLAGPLLDFDGTYLQIGSEHGPVSVIYDRVICAGVDCPVDGEFIPRIRMSAVPDVAEVLLPALTQRFATMEGMRSRTEQADNGHFILTLEDASRIVARFDIRPATADEGFADLVAFEADVVMSRRDVSEQELQMVAEARVAEFDRVGQNRIIGFDALIPVMSPGRQLAYLSPQSLLDVYRGRITDWADFGSESGPIRLHMSEIPPGWPDVPGPTVRLHPDFETAVAAVVSDPSALGIVSFQNSGFAQQIDLQDSCGFVASPDQTAVKTGDYPLTVPLYLYHADRRLPEILTAFLDWLPSPQAQLVVRRSGFVDSGLVPIALDDQGQRFVGALQAAEDGVALAELQSLSRRIADRTRLSMSFRFQPGGTRLDSTSRAHVLRLAQAVESGAFDARSILLLGFSDGQGAAELNQSLSLRRAEAVRDALAGALAGGVPDSVQVDVSGFGEALPVGCDDTAWGRQQNRRVELWVSD